MEEKLKIDLEIDNLLLEASRRDLLSKGRKGDNYSPFNQYKGKNRFERKKHSRVADRVKNYNDIDMNNFFYNDILTIGIPVTGETDNYLVKVKLYGILAKIREKLKKDNYKFEYKIIYQSAMEVMNSGDVYFNCTCPDFKYRFKHWAVKNNYSVDNDDPGPGKGIANPNDTKGSGCKHSLLVLANLFWILKMSSTINNYIHFMAERNPNLFKKAIFPALYEMDTKKAVDQGLMSQEELDSSKDLIDTINQYGSKRTQYKKAPAKSINPRSWEVKKKKDTEEEREEK